MDTPFVGPRPFSQENTIYGRDAEISELRWFVGAKRIVLLHSPSGAGKSSLLNARNGLLAKLRESRRFEIWGPARVNEDPRGLTVANRFMWSAINEFEKSRSGARRSPEELAQITLAAYLRERNPSLSPLLVFDQFEEVLRLDGKNTDAKRRFFEQAGEALADPRVWALFVMREDYLAALSPYARQIPTHLQSRFRINFLRREDQALDAMCGPLAALNRSFAARVPEDVLNDLAAGGDYVEPLQLQVILSNMWERVKDSPRTITRADVGEIGGALGSYYRNKVKREGDPETERQIRDWFEDTLISKAGARNLVREEDLGLPLDIVKQLGDAYLVRPESRAGGMWYELAHDRLVEPVLADNKQWRLDNLSPLQRAADYWEEKKRSKDVLLRGKALSEARDWAKRQAMLRPLEGEFLRESIAARRGLWLMRGVFVLALVAAAAAGGFAWQSHINSLRAEANAMDAMLQAEEAKCKALEARWSAQIAAEKEELAKRREREANVQSARADHEAAEAHRSLAKADVSAHETQMKENRPDLAAAYVARALQLDPGLTDVRKAAVRLVIGEPWYRPGPVLTHAGRITRVATGNGGNGLAVATASEDGTARLWDGSTGRALSPPLVHGAKVRLVEIRNDGAQLVTVDEAGIARLWDAPWQASVLPAGSPVLAAAYDAKGERLITGGADGVARLWTVEGKALAEMQHGSPVDRVVFGRSGIATASKSTVKLWTTDGQFQRELMATLRGPVTGVSFFADGAAVARREGKASLYPNIGQFATKGFLLSVNIADQILAFGNVVVVGSRGEGLSFWNRGGDRIANTLLPRSYVSSLAIGPDGRIVAALGVISESCHCSGARLFDSGRLGITGAPLLHAAIEEARPGPDGSTVVTAGGNTARVWFGIDRYDQALNMLRQYPDTYAYLEHAPAAVMGALVELAGGFQIGPEGDPVAISDARRAALLKQLGAGLPRMEKKLAEEVRRFLP